MAKLFVEVVVAPEFGPEARRRFGDKKNLRLVACQPFRPIPREVELRALDGGFLAQAFDTLVVDPSVWTCPTQRAPTEEEQRALELAWKVAQHVKSNAIVVANCVQTVGIGAGQMSRVDACRLAVSKAHIETEGSAAASDAFFPFPDGL